MGPNGSGKSTLSNVLMGKPGYEVTGGSVTLDGVDLLALDHWQRAQAGLSWPCSTRPRCPASRVRGARGGATPPPGATGRWSLDAPGRRGGPGRASNRSSCDRSLNVDLSGGEKKRNETVQLAVLSTPHRHPRRDRLGPRRRRVARGVAAHRVGDVDGVFPDGPADRAPRRAGDHPLQPAARGAPRRRGAHLRPGRILESGGPEIATRLEERATPPGSTSTEYDGDGDDESARPPRRDRRIPSPTPAPDPARSPTTSSGSVDERAEGLELAGDVLPHRRRTRTR